MWMSLQSFWEEDVREDSVESGVLRRPMFCRELNVLLLSVHGHVYMDVYILIYEVCSCMRWMHDFIYCYIYFCFRMCMSYGIRSRAGRPCDRILA